jgi:hypothetical protein
MRSTSLVLMITAGAAIAACSSSSAAPNSASPGEDAGGTEPAADAGGSSDATASSTEGGAADGGGASISGQVVDASAPTAAKNFDATQYSGLSGVEVCLYGQASAPCATTDANVNYSLAVPLGAAFTISYSKTGYAPVLYAQGAQTAGTTDSLAAIFMTSTSSSDSFQTMAGMTPDPTKGLILFGGGTIGASPGAMYHEMFGTYDYYYVPGYSVTISPAATVGPVYVSAAWEPDPSLTAASVAGWGLIQAPPGNYTLMYSSPTLKCGTTTTTVVAGYSTTYVGVACSAGADSGAPVGDASMDAAPVGDAAMDAE